MKLFIHKKCKALSMLIVLLCSFSRTFTVSLDELGLKNGTDKSSSFHNYTPTYEFYFSPFQNKNIKFLEIGFAGGGSARMWDAYFSNPSSRLYFLDVDPGCFNRMNDLSSRCSLDLVDQGSEEALTAWVKSIGAELDLVVDDGGHKMHQQIASFKALFPYLKKGGVYVIEDLHTSYWAWYGSAGNPQNPKASPTSAVRFLQSLVDDLNFIGAATECANREKYIPVIKSLSPYQSQIASIHFHSSMCLIVKG